METPTTTTSAAIVRWYESKPQQHRGHLGCSLLGDTCERKVWLGWRWALSPKFGGRILRLFDSGKREEQRPINELRGIGAQVWDVDPATGDQWRVSSCGGHLAGSLDGVVKGIPECPDDALVLEIKTHGAKSFADLTKKGVKESKPVHYAQMTLYMGLMELPRALYFAVNKDTDELHTEVVAFDREHFDALIARAQRIIDSTQPPYRISTDPDHFECKWCGFHAICHAGQSAEVNCRTCCHSTPIDAGAWKCERKAATISEDEQRIGCDEHLIIPGLVPQGEPVDGGEGYVVYRMPDGRLFANGPANCTDIGAVFSSKELHGASRDVIGTVIDLKNEFAGAKVASGSVKVPQKTGSSFDDMESDDLDAVPTKPSTKAQKEAAAKRSRTAKAIMEGKM